MFKIFSFLFMSLFAFSVAAQSTLNRNEGEELDPHDLLMAIFNDELEYDELDAKNITDPAILAAIPDLTQDALNNISRGEIESDIDSMEIIATVGDPQLLTIEVYKINGKPVAIGLRFHQDGGAVNESASLMTTHFATEEEAKAAGVDTSRDVCWSGKAYYTWDGIKWAPIDYTDDEGRGFSWCGW